MKKILIFFFACVMLVAFNSCERTGEVTEPETTTEEDAIEDEDDSTEDDDDSNTTEQPSPIKGLWECQLSGGYMILNFGDSEVEYKCHTDLMNTLAIYKGTYAIEGMDIIMEFTSLSSKPSNVNFYAPEDMPKNAVLKDEETIEYLDKEFLKKE